MATAGEVAHAALADLNAEAAGILNALRWVSERYTQVCNKRLRHRKADGEVIIPAAVTAGTVTVTRGSTAVVGNATALAAWSSKLIGRFFQVDLNWYEIQESTATGLRLVSPYTETTAAAVAYKLVSRYTALAPNVAFLGSFKHDRRNFELEFGSKRELDLVEPRRLYRVSGPQYVADVGERNGLTLLEVYPYSTQDELLRYDYWTQPPDFTDEDDALPSIITVKDLKEGVLIDCMRWWAAKEAIAGKSDMAGYWRNEYRAQESRWEKVMQDIYRRDRSPEQMHLMIRDPNRRAAPATIRSARDEVWSRY